MFHLEGLGHNGKVSVAQLKQIFKLDLDEDVTYFKSCRSKINMADGSLITPASTGLRTTFTGWHRELGESFSLTYYTSEKRNQKNPAVIERLPHKQQFIGSQMRFDKRQSNDVELAAFYLLHPWCKDSVKYYDHTGSREDRYELFSPNAAAKAKMERRRDKSEFLAKLTNDEDAVVIGIGLGFGDHNTDADFILDKMHEAAEINYAEFRKLYEDPAVKVSGVCNILKAEGAIKSKALSSTTFEWKFGNNFKGAKQGEAIVTGMGTEVGILTDYLMRSEEKLQMFTLMAYTILKKEKSLSPEEIKKTMAAAKSLDGAEVNETFTRLQALNKITFSEAENSIDVLLLTDDKSETLFSIPNEEQDHNTFILFWANQNKDTYNKLKKIK